MAEPTQATIMPITVTTTITATTMAIPMAIPMATAMTKARGLPNHLNRMRMAVVQGVGAPPVSDRMGDMR